MLIASVRTAPPNSIVLVEDELGGEIPETINTEVAVATNSCIAVGCRSEDDGDTEICIFDDVEGISDPLVFFGTIETPNKNIYVRTVVGDALLSVQVPGGATEIRVFANDASEPDRISFVIGRCIAISS